MRLNLSKKKEVSTRSNKDQFAIDVADRSSFIVLWRHSASVSITDPPYEEEKYLSLYEDLPAIVYKKLKPGAISFLYMEIKLRIDTRIVLKGGKQSISMPSQ